MESISSMPETQVTWMMKKCQSGAVAQKFKAQGLYQEQIIFSEAGCFMSVFKGL